MQWQGSESRRRGCCTPARHHREATEMSRMRRPIFSSCGWRSRKVKRARCAGRTISDNIGDSNRRHYLPVEQCQWRRSARGEGSRRASVSASARRREDLIEDSTGWARGLAARCDWPNRPRRAGDGGPPPLGPEGVKRVGSRNEDVLSAFRPRDDQGVLCGWRRNFMPINRAEAGGVWGSIQHRKTPEE